MITLKKLSCFATIIGSLLIAGVTKGGDAKCIIDDKCPVEFCKENPAFCDIFNHSTLYKNENACLIQKVALTGRYHGQYHDTRFS